MLQVLVQVQVLRGPEKTLVQLTDRQRESEFSPTQPFPSLQAFRGLGGAHPYWGRLLFYSVYLFKC